MKSPEEVRSEAKRRFANRCNDWLTQNLQCSGPQESHWPAEFSLGAPTEQEANSRLDDVRAWTVEWRALAGPGEVKWVERKWRNLGTQSVPERLIFQTPGELADFAGEQVRWSRMLGVGQKLLAQWPQLKSNIARWSHVLANLEDQDLARLFSMLRWIESHPESGLCVRQLPIAGMDTKWIELRTGIISGLLHEIRGHTGDLADFYGTCGLRPLPQYLHVRILDPQLRREIGELADLTAPVEQIGCWKLLPDVVIIVENVQTGLAFEDMPGTIVILGLGYSVDLLQKLPWLHTARCFYWGDLDTHGFAILNRARSYLPRLQSILMDEETLLDHKNLWVEEREQAAADVLPLLTGAEHAVYRGLKLNVWGQHVRLEQERISWSFVDLALRRGLGQNANTLPEPRRGAGS